MTRDRSTRHGKRNNGIRCRNPKHTPRLSFSETMARLTYGMQNIGRVIAGAFGPPVEAATENIMKFASALESFPLVRCKSMLEPIIDETAEARKAKL